MTFQNISSARVDDVANAAVALRDDAAAVLANTPFLLTRCSSDLRYLFITEAYAKMLGHVPEEVVGKKIVEVIGETAFNTILPYVEAVLSGHRVEYETVVHYRDVGPRFVHVTYIPDRDQLGQVRGWVASISDITERRQVEAALHESDQRSRWLASIVESSDDSIITKNLDGIITSWNKAAERLFGYTAQEAIGKPVTILIPLERHDDEPAILARIRRGERIDHYETIRQRKDGSFIDISLTVSPIKNAQGKITGASKIARDITGRKRNDAYVAMLAREAEHRTKNILATVQATVNLSRSDTADGLKRAIEGRIQALAKLHDLFVKSHWTGAELYRIASQELAPYVGGDKARVRIDGPNVLLPPNAAQAIGVTLHELATNAAKYGSLSAPKGQVEVTWSRSADGRLILHWTESGGPPANKPMRQGFGTAVIERMIGEQLKGEIHLDWRAEGLACEIVLQTSET